MANFYADVWQQIAKFLESDDLFSMSITCKAANRAFRRHEIQAKISFPMILGKRLTFDQRDVIRRMESNSGKVKLVSSAVGSGKSIVALSYALRNNFDRIFILVPPSLINMWWDTCKKFFGINPLVLHNCNPKYRKTFDDSIMPDEKIILISYKIFQRNRFPWIDTTNCLGIIDEAHHSVWFHNKFAQVVGLSATIFSRNNLAMGIRNLLDKDATAVSLDSVTFNLDQTLIASKLPPVEHLPPYKWKIDKELIDYITKRLSPPLKDGGNNLFDISWVSEILSHPFLSEIGKYYFGGHHGYVTAGKKKLHINGGNNTLFTIEEAKFKEDNIELFGSDLGLYYRKLEKKQQEFAQEYLKDAMRHCIKYYQVLSILKYIEKRGEKAILFDNNITNLPFLHKFLLDKGMKSYMFTTHYDVASRQRQIEKFKKDEDANVLLSSTAILGEGHNITEANHVIFLSSMSDKNKYYQSIGRCNRYPQNKKVYVHHLFNSELDEMIYESSLGTCNLSTLNWVDALSK